MFSAHPLLESPLVKCIHTVPVYKLFGEASQAYDFMEVFSGMGWLTRTMGSSGKATAAFDILLGSPEPGKQDVMDLTTDSGFWFLDLRFVAVIQIKVLGLPPNLARFIPKS